MLNEAINMARRKQIGEMLIDAGLITLHDLQHALGYQTYYSERLGQTLVRFGYITDRQLLRFLGKQYNTPAVDLYEQSIDENAVRLIDKGIAEEFKVFPIGFNKTNGTEKLVLAMDDPLNQGTINHISRLTNFPIYPVFAREEHLKWIINYYYNQKDIRIDIKDNDDETIMDLGQPISEKNLSSR